MSQKPRWKSPKGLKCRVGGATRPLDTLAIDRMCKHPILDTQTTYALIAKARTNGCQKVRQEAEQKLVLHNIRLVGRMAKRYARQADLSYADLVGEGILGLIEAVRRFDASKGFTFATYAVWWIRHDILQAIQDMEVVLTPKNVRALSSTIKRVGTRRALLEGRYHLDIEDIIETLDMPRNDASRRQVTRAVLHLDRGKDSFDVGISKYRRSALTLHDVMPDTEAWLPDDLADRNISVAALRQAIAQLDDREQKVLARTFWEERTLASVARDPDIALCRERVRQIQGEAVVKLRKNLCKAPPRLMTTRPS